MYSDNYNYNSHLQDNETPYGVVRNPSDGFNFNRQDSLAEAASLQERDHSCNMINFMDKQIVICDYIRNEGMEIGKDCFPEHEYDMDDYLKHGDYSFGPEVFENSFQEIDSNIDYDTASYDTSDRSQTHVSVPATANVPTPQIKQEIQEYEEEKPYDDEVVARPNRRARNHRNSSIDADNFTPKTRARRYVLKNEKEKATEEYRLKRAKNNDAVRKSRCKQKSEQQKCIDEKISLARQNQEILKENAKLREEVRTLKEIVSQKDEQIRQFSF
ncbi:unnamed protein product [Auanema sp. JU1783]|nr:unnamed protein product [Auanema sp. JU1783]